jgi:hypothetical protein
MPAGRGPSRERARRRGVRAGSADRLPRPCVHPTRARTSVRPGAGADLGRDDPGVPPRRPRDRAARLRELLEAEATSRSSGEAGTAEEAYGRIPATSPTSRPRRPPARRRRVEVCREIRSTHPRSPAHTDLVRRRRGAVQRHPGRRRRLRLKQMRGTDIVDGSAPIGRGGLPPRSLIDQPRLERLRRPAEPMRWPRSPIRSAASSTSSPRA